MFVHSSPFNLLKGKRNPLWDATTPSHLQPSTEVYRIQPIPA
jgi:hypothetical protein